MKQFKMVSVLLILSLLLSIFVPYVSFAAEDTEPTEPFNPAEIYIKSHMDTITNIAKTTFENNGVTINSISNSNGHIYISASKGTTLKNVNIDYDVINGNGTIISKNSTTPLNYTFLINDLNENAISAVLTNVDTGVQTPITTSFSASNNPGVVYAVPVPPVFLDGIGSLLEILGKTIAASDIVKEGGKVLIEASKVLNVANNDKNTYNYFMAALSNNKVFIGDGLNKAAAVKRGKAGHDLWAKSKSLARGAAAAINTKGAPIQEDAHGSEGYFDHYHPYKRTPKMHVFYGSSHK